MRKATSLHTDNPNGMAPTIISSKTDLDMAAEIAQRVVQQIASGTLPKEVVVLYRTNYASRVLEQALRDQHVKYKIIGGLSFWQRKEIKAAISILKLKCNHGDRMAFEKSVEMCCRGVGEKAIGAINEMAQTRNLSIFEAAKQFSTGKIASARSLTPFIKAFDSSYNLLPGQGLIQLAQSTAFWDRIEIDSTDTNDRCGNVLEIARDVDDYCSKDNHTLAGYLQNLSLIQAGDEDEDDSGLVKLMTLHGCKGLEFDAVFISHCIAELLPHSRAIQEATNDEERKSATEEERRLLYVGMTRARKRLSLFFCESKMDARFREAKQTFPSPFLFETGIPFKYSPKNPQKSFD